MQAVSECSLEVQVSCLVARRPSTVKHAQFIPPDTKTLTEHDLIGEKFRCLPVALYGRGMNINEF